MFFSITSAQELRYSQCRTGKYIRTLDFFIVQRSTFKFLDKPELISIILFTDGIILNNDLAWVAIFMITTAIATKWCQIGEIAKMNTPILFDLVLVNDSDSMCILFRADLTN